jgi:hypothetical protein
MNSVNIKMYGIIFVVIQLLLQTSTSMYTYLRHNKSNSYINKVNSLCPNDLVDNEAGKIGLYFNTTDYYIKKSIELNFFSHCGAWCLFDYRDPTKGWFWNKDNRTWNYYNNIYYLCPFEEFNSVIKKYISLCNKN